MDIAPNDVSAELVAEIHLLAQATLFVRWGNRVMLIAVAGTEVFLLLLLLRNRRGSMWCRLQARGAHALCRDTIGPGAPSKSRLPWGTFAPKRY